MKARPQMWYEIETGHKEELEVWGDALTLEEAVKEGKAVARMRKLSEDDIYIQKIYAHGDWNTKNEDTFGQRLKLSTAIKRVK